MEKEFVPYEQALQLKELGFDWECFCGYNKDKLFVQLKNNITANYNNPHSYDTLSGYNDNKYTTISAPLYQQAFKWFREKHSSHSCISAINNGEELFYAPIIDITDKEHEAILDFDVYETYEEAELECLKKLIELCKNNI